MGNVAIRLVLRAVGYLVVLPYIVVLLVVLTGAPTWSGLAYVAGLGLLVAGLATLPVSAEGRRPGVTRAAMVFLFAIAFVRCCTAGEGSSLRFEPSARIVDRLVDERDIALSGARVLVAGHGLSDDANELPAKMREAYVEMGNEQGDAPSPVLATYLGMQSPDAYDTLVFEPKDTPAPIDAIVFLHGFAGNFALPCWQVAKAVADLHILTVCPSTRWVGDWGSANGEATLRKTVAALRERGIKRIVLAGLSAGGYGASELAPKLRGSFVGLVLVSGARPEAPYAGVPTLLIHGRRDTMAGYEDALDYAAGHGDAKVVTLDAGHFAMLVRREQANRALHDFVASVLGKRVALSSARRSL